MKRNSHVGIVRIPFSVALEHQDPDEILRRVGPTLRAVCSAVSERTRRENAVALNLRRVFYQDETQPPRHPGTSFQIAGLLTNHLSDGRGLENALAVERALVEHHLIEAGNILRRGE